MAEKLENLNLGINTKKRFTIDGDENKILEIDVQDMSIMSRIKPAMKKINGVKSHWEELQKIDPDNISDEEMDELQSALEESEKEMREGIDFLFNTNVCEVCLGNTSAFTPIDGKLKYEIIITTLSGLYEKTIKAEMGKFDVGKVNKRVQKRVQKPVHK